MHLKLLSLGLIFANSLLIYQTLADDAIFKLSKLNLIWMKAQHSLGTNKLKELKSDLSKHELDELNLKKLKSLNQDKDGLHEAAIRKRLLVIMSKYSLERYYDDVHPPIETEHERKKSHLENVKLNPDQNESPDISKHTFRDKRLDKLWKKAEVSGFSDEELMILHEEFQHQQDRLVEHYEAMNSIDLEMNKREKQDRDLENSIEADFHTDPKRKKAKAKETPSEKKARLDTNIHQSLKKEYSAIKRDIDKLHQKIVSGKVGISDGPFEEEPVNELWAKALKSNFTSEELETFKEELDHYEVRIKKLKHFQNQLDRDNIGSKDSKTYGEESDETKHIKRRVKDLKYKVAKTHESLRRRAENTRDEL